MLTFNNIAIKIGSTNAWISNTYIPKRTLRFRFLAWDDDVPTDHLPTLAELQSWQASTPKGTWSQIGTNVFDWTCKSSYWGANNGTQTTLYQDTASFFNAGRFESFLRHIKFDIIGADLSGVTNIAYLFSYMHIVHCCTFKNADRVTSAKYLFQSQNINAATLESVGQLNLPLVENTSSMFVYQSKLVSIDGITTSADLSNMSEMFSSCTSLVSVPLFNTSGVTNAYRAFWNCHALTSIPAFDFSSVTASNVGNLFCNCEKVQSGLLAIYNQFNTSGLTPDYTAFFNCGIDTASGVAELEQIPGVWGGKLISTDPIAADTLRCKYSSAFPSGSSWTVNAVDAYNGIFDLTLHTTWHNKAVLGNPISVIGQGDCSTIASVRGVFYRKTNLTSVCDLSFPAATTAQDLFENCSALETVGNISLPSCTNVSGMFYGCSSLTSVPLFDTSRVTAFGVERGMLAGCTSLKTVPLYNTSSATVTSNMCDGCTAVESGALSLYQQASTQATPPTSHTNMFKNCGANTTSGSAELAQIPSDWGGTGS